MVHRGSASKISGIKVPRGVGGVLWRIYWQKSEILLAEISATKVFRQFGPPQAEKNSVLPVKNEGFPLETQ